MPYSAIKSEPGSDNMPIVGLFAVGVVAVNFAPGDPSWILYTGVSFIVNGLV